MGDFEMVFRVDVDAPQEAAVRALTTGAGVEGWWTDRAQVSGDVGATLLFTFPGMPQPFDLTLAERSEGRVAWRAGAFPPPWAGTEVVWEVRPNPDGAGTRIDMRHAGWERDNPMVGIVTVGWGQILGHLKGYLESGTPQPFFTN